MGGDESHTRRSRLSVAVSDEYGQRLQPALSRWLAAIAPARARGKVNIALVSDRRVRALNRQYRGIDHATDVLSFPAGNQAHSPQKPQKTSRRAHFARSANSAADHFLGDIVIAQGVARRQARTAGHDESTELRVLALHGLLHLLGYDHERDSGTMARLERRLRKKGGLREGLIERP